MLDSGCAVASTAVYCLRFTKTVGRQARDCPTLRDLTTWTHVRWQEPIIGTLGMDLDGLGLTLDLSAETLGFLDTPVAPSSVLARAFGLSAVVAGLEVEVAVGFEVRGLDVCPGTRLAHGPDLSDRPSKPAHIKRVTAN